MISRRKGKQKYGKNLLVAPVLKWVGGKRQLLDLLVSLLPEKFSSYCEPFVGGGALLFRIQPKMAFVSDINDELIGVYRVIKEDVEALISALQEYKNESEYFYNVRDWDRDREKYVSLPAVQKAARILYLNKTCYNGLFRVNSAGEFNSPFGNYRNPSIVNVSILRAVSSYFNTAKIHLSSNDYADTLKLIPKDTFTYLDPPYDPVSDTSSFTGYSKDGFKKDDQIRLRECCDDLDERGLKFMLSNSATDFIKEQYAAYNITVIRAKRAINSDSTKRGEVDEIIVRNYAEAGVGCRLR
ncbi:MAG: DNA adenine methylase [Planctomycetaceae bacterium]|jgi:DNA adenine methylase|nr:DNA adenine methylase [Planctomycetaceae bacterium]